MKKIDSPEELVEDILLTRRKTQGARFEPLPSGVEKVKDVLNESMSNIATEFVAEGFSYAKSKKQISRVIGGFRQEITLESDSANLSGIHIGVGFQVSVRSNAFKKWEKETFSRDSHGYIFVTQIGYMTSDYRLLKWQLVDPESRDIEIKSIISNIKNYVLPFFDYFANAETFHHFLRKRDFSVLCEGYVVAYAVWLNDKPLAETIVMSILANKSVELEKMHQYINEYKVDGYPEEIFAGDHAMCWARDSVILGLFDESST